MLMKQVDVCGASRRLPANNTTSHFVLSSLPAGLSSLLKRLNFPIQHTHTQGWFTNTANTQTHSRPKAASTRPCLTHPPCCPHPRVKHSLSPGCSTHPQPACHCGPSAWAAATRRGGVPPFASPRHSSGSATTSSHVRYIYVCVKNKKTSERQREKKGGPGRRENVLQSAKLAS